MPKGSTRVYPGLVEQLKRLPAADVSFLFFAVQEVALQHLQQTLQTAGLDVSRARFLRRGEPIRNEIKDRQRNQRVVVLGYVDEDFILAANFKALLLVAGWALGGGGPEQTSDKIVRYGNPVPRVDQLDETITILLHQRTPLLHLSFPLTEDERQRLTKAPADFRCDVICLSSANTFGRVAVDTVDVIEAYKAVLKEDEQTWKLVFRYYLLAFVFNHQELFADVQDWCVIPSSRESVVGVDGAVHEVGSAVMEQCKEIVRHMLGGRKASPMFRRARTVPQNRFRAAADKAAAGAAATINYPSLHLNKNNEYDAKKLKGRVVCVFDDYTTSGNSFEAARSLLLAVGVKRVVMVALGKFGFVYNYETFVINGDPFTPTYTWQSVRRQEMNVRGQMEDQAIAEFTGLLNMVKLRQPRDLDVDEKKAE